MVWMHRNLTLRCPVMHHGRLTRLEDLDSLGIWQGFPETFSFLAAKRAPDVSDS